MSKKLICLLVVGLALVLTPFLVLAEQPDMEGPDPQVPEYICLEDLPIAPDPQRPHQSIYLELPPMEAPERPMHEYIYQTGTPDLKRVKSFYESQEEVLGQRVVELLDYADPSGGPIIVALGYAADGYYSVLLDTDRWNGNWDVIDRTVEQLQELGGEDFPIAFWVGTVSCAVETLDAEEVETEVVRGSTDVTGGDAIYGYYQETECGYLRMSACFRTKRLGFFYDERFVTAGHFLDCTGSGDPEPIPMPIKTKIYDDDDTSLGYVELVGGDEADASRVKSGWRWSILPGVRHYGTRIPIETWYTGLPPEGHPVWKTGSTTDTTFGYVVDISDVHNPAHGLMEDQVIADFEWATGDSGGPVYVAIADGGSVYAALGGIFWGGLPNGYGIFSPIEAVLEELGGIEPMLGL